MKGFQVKEVAKLCQSLLNCFSRRLFLILKQNVNHIYQKLEQKQTNKLKPITVKFRKFALQCTGPSE